MESKTHTINPYIYKFTHHKLLFDKTNIIILTLPRSHEHQTQNMFCHVCF
jgi:hypothetical protein